MKAVVLAIVVGFGTLGAAARAGDSWQTLRPDGTIFAISFPGRPLEESHDAAQTGGGKVNMTTYHLVANNVVYMLQDTAVQSNLDALSSQQSAVMLLNVQGNFAKSSGASVVASQPAIIQKHAARVLMLQKDGVYFRGYTVNVDKHNLIVLVAASQSDINSAVVTKFLSSLRVVNT